MPKTVSNATKENILRNLLNPTMSVKDIIKIYRDVCSQQMIYTIGTENDIDWGLRTRLEEALNDRNRLDALIVEMENAFFDKVKRVEDEEVSDHPIQYQSYRSYYRSYRR